MAQYRITSPGANGVDYEEFFMDLNAATTYFDATADATLWRGDETTSCKWVVVMRKARPSEHSALRKSLRFD
jgi:hypothetical protein